jgi:hypothetical protein
MEGTEWDKGKSKEKYRIVGNGRNIMGHRKIEGTGWDKETGRNRMGTMGNGRKRIGHNGKGEERSGTEQNKKKRKGLGVKWKIMTAVYAET